LKLKEQARYAKGQLAIGKSLFYVTGVNLLNKISDYKVITVD